MKKKMIIPVFLALSIVMVMFGTTAAAPTISTIAISGPGVVWQFNPDPLYGEVTAVEAYYYLTDDPLNPVLMPEPIKTIISDNLVTLIFAHSFTGGLTGFVDTTAVHVTATLGVYDQPAGPGFAWGRTR